MGWRLLSWLWRRAAFVAPPTTGAATARVAKFRVTRAQRVARFQ